MRALAWALALAAAAHAAPSPPASLRIEDRDGRPLRLVPNAESLDCRPVPLARISPFLALATVAVEDQRFYQHGAVDLQAVARAVAQNIRAGKVVSGASTLTEQLARSLEPRPRTLWGKVKEAAGAMRLEREYSKQEILEAYLNRAPYGNRCQGAEAASQYYFGEPAADLSLAQAALLAGIPKSPGRFDPVANPQEARRRQRFVLERMEAGGWVDAESLRLARAEPWHVEARPRVFEAPHYTELLRALAPQAPFLKATLDGSLQADLQALVRTQLATLKSRHVRNAALVVLDNSSGEVLAWVGSQDFSDADGQGQVDGVSAKRQPGSALKPFLYSLAFERGFRPSSRLDDEPWVAPDGYAAYNYDRQYHGLVSLRRALACSYNVPAVRLCDKVGVGRFYDRLKLLGFDSLDLGAGHYGLGLALGNGEVSLLELANAYATLARGGRYLPVRLVRGAEIPPQGAPPHQAIEPGAAWLALEILGDNGARAPAFGLTSALSLPFPLAAKTGTTKDYHDNWCVGVTPQWTVAAWCGNFDASPMQHVSGVTGAGPLMHDAALRVERRWPSTAFPRPPDVVELELCDESGELPTLRCPRLRREYCLAGNLPTQTCHLHPLKAEGAAPPAAGRPRIVVPSQGARYVIEPGMDRDAQDMNLKAEGVPDGARVQWRVDGRPADLDDRGQAFYRLTHGWHEVALAVCDGGRTRTARTVTFSVLK
jgi:penicillin-binding protein 1C